MGLCLVCLSVKSHLTSGASVRSENTVTYSAGNKGQKNCGVFSETAPLQRSSTAPLKAYVRSAIFLRKARIALYSACVCKVRARVAPRVLHFSAFIVACYHPLPLSACSVQLRHAISDSPARQCDWLNRAGA